MRVLLFADSSMHLWPLFAGAKRRHESGFGPLCRLEFVCLRALSCFERRGSARCVDIPVSHGRAGFGVVLQIDGAGRCVVPQVLFEVARVFGVRVIEGHCKQIVDRPRAYARGVQFLSILSLARLSRVRQCVFHVAYARGRPFVCVVWCC